MPKICQTANANFSLPNAVEKCQIRVIWHFKMPVGNPASVSRLPTIFQRLMPSLRHFTAKWLLKMPKYSTGRIAHV